jgi:hypothetical protein
MQFRLVGLFDRHRTNFCLSVVRHRGDAKDLDRFFNPAICVTSPAICLNTDAPDPIMESIWSDQTVGGGGGLPRTVCAHHYEQICR